MTYRPCTCGHAEGDHKSSGSSFPHPLDFGICLVPGCGCRVYENVGGTRKKCAECCVPLTPGDGGVRAFGLLFCSEECVDEHEILHRWHLDQSPALARTRESEDNDG